MERKEAGSPARCVLSSLCLESPHLGCSSSFSLCLCTCLRIPQVAIGIGDLTLAYQCLKIAISISPDHAEAYNNLGVLEYRKGNDDQARSFFRRERPPGV